MSNEKITINTEDLSTEPIVSTTASSTPFQPVQTKPPITLHQQTVISSYNMKFVVILMLLNFLLTLVLCVGVGYLAFYQPEKNIPQQKQKQERKWEPEPPIKQETSLNTKNKIEPVTKQNETTPIDEKTIPKNETEIEIEIESKTEPEPETESESESETEKPIE